MSSPPAKRQRTEDAPITRSEIWKRDGSVVLQAANTRFRVHWTILEQSSTVFRYMQALSQPVDQPSVDGCPVVEISADPRDVEQLLNALYIPTFLSQKALPLPTVGALIRLGRKYQFKDLFDSAVARLTDEYPITLEEFDAVRGRLKTIQPYTAVRFDAMILASESKILSALPCAYYTVVEISSLGELLDGIQRPDGTVARLTGLDLRRCVVARERLLAKQFQEGYTLGWARKWQFDDCAKAQCRTGRESILNWYLEDAEMGALELPTRIMGGFHELCAVCSQHARQSTVAGRKKMWEQLPEFFDLPPWNELKNRM